MPELKNTPKTLPELVGDHHYPANVDSMISSDTPFEGTSSKMPSESPVYGVTTVSNRKIKKAE